MDVRRRALRELSSVHRLRNHHSGWPDHGRRAQSGAPGWSAAGGRRHWLHEIRRPPESTLRLPGRPCRRRARRSIPVRVRRPPSHRRSTRRRSIRTRTRRRVTLRKDIAMTTPTVARVKKLINRVDDVVPESLAGLGAAHPDLVQIDALNRVVLRAGGPKQGKVGLVSGGGSGHEPLHGGFVGLGRLDAACAGNVFTSPTPDQMEAATRAVDGGTGVLHIVKNYTGDVLNFQMAAELVAGEVEVASVVTNDDVAVKDSLYTAGRRGVGVTVLLEKIAGARAEQGASLAEVTATAVKVHGQGRSLGLALSSCIVPAPG